MAGPKGFRSPRAACPKCERETAVSSEQTGGARRLRRHDPCGVVWIGRETPATVPILGETEPLTRAVLDAIGAAELKPRHAGTVALATRYATLIDNASPPTKYRESIAAVMAGVETLDAMGAVVGVDYRKHFMRIVDALSAHSVASDLGPKLLAAMTSLGLTVGAAPAAIVPARGGGGKVDSVAAVSALDQLRARRAQRAGQNGA